MEEFVRRLHEERARVTGQVFARRTQGDRVTMLERAIRAVLEQEGVVAIGCSAKQRDGLMHDALHAGQERRRVERRGIRERPVDDTMRHPGFGELPVVKVPDEDRRVHERGRVRSGECPSTRSPSPRRGEGVRG